MLVIQCILLGRDLGLNCASSYGGHNPAAIQKEITSQNDEYLVILSSKTYVFEDELAKHYSILISPYPVKGCGEEVYISDQKEITSPNYGENKTYPTAVTCQWIITAPSSQHLQLEVLDFAVEYHSLCIWDYLAVAEGDCSSSFKTRYCGGIQQVPQKITFNSNKACIKFVSDFVIPERGFRLLVDCIAVSGNETSLKSNIVSITSTPATHALENEDNSSLDGPIMESTIDNQNQPTPDTASASTTSSSVASPVISSSTMKTGEQTTLLDVLYNIPKQTAISTSPKSVSWSASSSSTSSSLLPTNKQISAEFDKSGLSSSTSFSHFSSLSTKFMHLSTTSSTKTSASLSSLSNLLTSVPESFVSSSTFRVTSTTEEATVELCPGSKTVWVSSMSVVVSPITHDGKYLPNTDCSLLFQTADANILKVEFTSFDIEHHPDCFYDRLSIYDGNDITTEAVNITPCGSALPESLLSSGPCLLMKFESDHVVQRTGFEAKINALPKLTTRTDKTSPLTTPSDGEQEIQCICNTQENVIIDGDVFVQTPNYGPGTSYPLSIAYSLSVESLSGQRLRLEFIDFEVESAQDCRWDSVSIYDGSSQESPLLAKYCGYTLPAVVETSGTKMCIKFVSDQYINKSGMKGKLSAISELATTLSTSSSSTFGASGKSGINVSRDLSLPTSSNEPVTSTLLASQKSSLSSKVSTTSSATPNLNVSSSSTSPTSAGIVTASASSSTDSSSTSLVYSDTATTATTSTYNVSTNSPLTQGSYSGIITQTSVGGNTRKQSSDMPTTIPQLLTGSASSKIAASSLKSTHAESKAKSTTENAPAQIDICAESKVQVYEGVYIVSPGKETGSNYPVDRHCSLDITCQTDKHLLMEFKDFDLEFQSSCLWDYLEIFDLSDQSQLLVLGKFCGQMADDVVQSTSNHLKLVFNSDHIIPKKGFKLYIYAVAGETSKSSSVTPGQSVSSIGPPPASITITKSLIPTYSTTRKVSASVLSLKNQSEYSTGGQSIASHIVPDNESETVSISEENLNKSTSQQTTKTYTSFAEGSNLSTKSSSDFKISKTAAHASSSPYSVSESVSQVTTSVSDDLTKGSTSMEPNINILTTASHTPVYDVCSISVLEVQHEMYVISPGKDTDSNYPLNIHCVMELICKHNERLTLQFVDFDLEYHYSCIWDFLEIAQQNKTHGRSCGTALPAMINANSSYLKLVFHSDFVVPKKGFKVRVFTEKKHLEEATARTLTSQKIQTSQVFTPTVISKTSIDAMNNTTVKSKVTEESLSNQSETYVLNKDLGDESLSNDDTSSQPINGIHLPTYTTLKPKIGSSISADTATVSYSKSSRVTDAENLTQTNTGFLNALTRASLSPVTGTAVLPFTASSYSTVENKDKSPNIQDTRSIPNSTPDTQEVSYSTDNAPRKQAKKSSQEITLSSLSPTPITTLSADQSEACTGENSLKLSSRSGFITSPGYPNQQYPPNVTCNWEIDDQYHELIMILFQSFNVEKSENCRWDKLSIYEEYPSETRKLGVYCGNHIPPTITSSKKLHIQFTSDTLVENQGFKLQYIKTSGGNMSVSSHITCKAGKTPCYKSGSCIPVEWVCDGDPDCESGEDENSCALCSDSEFSCGNGTCIPLSQACSGSMECPYSLDEIGCVTAKEGTGVIIRQNGNDYSLCYSNDTSPEALDAVCKAAGYRFSISSGTIGEHTGPTVSLLDGNTTNSTTESLRFKISPCDSAQATSVKCHDEECGQREVVPVHKRVVGGSLSSPGEWPWIVAVKTGQSINCGGTIISGQWVVTAGHCVDTMIHNPHTVSVIAGTTDIHGSEGQTRVVTEIQLHPEYSNIYNMDIALLRLQRPLQLGSGVKTICLPWDKREFSTSSYCYIAGWGVKDMKDYFTTQRPKDLHHAKTKIVTSEICKSSYVDKATIKDSMICAGYLGGDIDACKGDSGGPLMCETGPGRWTLAGVISWGDMCGSFNKPGVYTKASSVLPWIDGILGRDDASKVSCSFESSDWCGYQELSGETFLWSRRPGGKSFTGKPTKDHTFGNSTGHYMYADSVVPGPSSTAEAIFQSPKFPNGNFACLRFAFIFGGHSNMKLSVFGLTEAGDGTEQLIWQVNSQRTKHKKWMETEVDLPSVVSHFKFVANRYSGNSGVGIDDVLLLPNGCEGMKYLQCNFDDGTFCGYEQHPDGYNVFTIHSKENSSDLYAAVDGSIDEFGFHSKSMLISPVLPKLFDNLEHCLTFHYKVKRDSSKLRVVTFADLDGNLINRKVHWTTPLGVAEEWITERVLIPNGHFDRLVFEGQRQPGATDNIAIAIDDIKLTNGNCV